MAGVWDDFVPHFSNRGRDKIAIVGGTTGIPVKTLWNIMIPTNISDHLFNTPRKQ